MKKRFNKEKALEKLQELNSSFKLVEGRFDDKIIDIEDGCSICLDECTLLRIQKGIPHTGNWKTSYALAIEYLHKYKDEIIIEEYTKEEVEKTLIESGFSVTDENVCAGYAWLGIVPNVIKYLNGYKKNVDRSEMALATVVKNNLEEKENE